MTAECQFKANQVILAMVSPITGAPLYAKFGCRCGRYKHADNLTSFCLISRGNNSHSVGYFKAIASKIGMSLPTMAMIGRTSQMDLELGMIDTRFKNAGA